MRILRKRNKKRKLKLYIILLSTIFVLLCSYIFLIRIDIDKNINLSVNSSNDIDVKGSIFFVDVTDKIKSSGSVDVSKVGTYKIVYNIGFIKRKTVTVNVLDREAPIIKLNGSDNVEAYLNQEYTELGYEVSDNYDNEVNVTVKGKVDTTKEGKYYLTYTAIDSSNNKSEVVRKVSVERISPLELSVEDFNLSEYFPSIMLQKGKDKGQAYLDKVVIAGDSVPWHFGNYYITSPSNVYARPCEGPSNFFSQKVYYNNQLSNYTLPELIVKNKPEYLYLHMGICDINQDNVTSFISNYEKAIDYIKKESPDTELVIMSLVPQTKEYLSWISLRNNVKINKFNYYIAKMCQEKNIKFLDIASFVKNSKGQAEESLFMSDGYHLNTKGMKKVMELIRYYE